MDKLKREKIFGLYGRGTKIAVNGRGIHEGELINVSYHDERKTVIRMKCNENTGFDAEEMPVDITRAQLLLRKKSSMTQDEAREYYDMQEFDVKGERKCKDYEPIMWLVEHGFALDNTWFDGPNPVAAEEKSL